MNCENISERDRYLYFATMVYYDYLSYITQFGLTECVCNLIYIYLYYHPLGRVILFNDVPKFKIFLGSSDPSTICTTYTIHKVSKAGIYSK